MDVNNCGGCGIMCIDRPNSTPFCSSSACGFNCDGTWGDCNGNVVDGCEVDLDSSPANCSSCGFVCNLPNSNEICVGGMCDVGSCLSGFYDVDGNPTNGCECADDSHANICSGAEDLGSLSNGASVNRTGKVAPSGGSDYFRVGFNNTGRGPGQGVPRVRFTTNEGNVFRMEVTANCSAGASACGSGGNASSITDWQFQDNASSGITGYSINGTSWPTLDHRAGLPHHVWR